MADQLTLQGYRILIVDDAPDNLQLIRTILGRAGAQTLLASNGQEALEAVAANRPDAIIMDLQMPIMDGHEATRQLRAKGYQRPIITLTAHALEQHRIQSFAAGCSDHLTKPVDRQHLIATIGRYLAKASAPTNGLPPLFPSAPG